MKYIYLFYASFLFLCPLASVAADAVDVEMQKEIERLSSMKGHMKPLGSVGPYFDLFTMEGFPSSPRDFFNKYVIPSTPLLMKNAAKISPAFTKWTDDYFLNHPASEKEEIFAEGRKKEIRTEPGSMMSFKQFVELYNTTDMYMVHGLPAHLRADVIIPTPLQCDPVIESVIDVVTWFSSGGTKSVLHNDDVENINCLYRGNKTLIFLNPHDDYNIWRNLIDRPEGGYSSMDVDAVDYTLFPDLADVRYAKVDMQAGDCLYIPFRWYHQVNSFGSNVAVNLWWRNQGGKVIDLTDEDCGDFKGRNTVANFTWEGMDGESAYQKPQDGDQPSTEEFLKRFGENKTDKDSETERPELKTEEESTETTVGEGISYSEDYEAKYLHEDNTEEERPNEPSLEQDPYIEEEEKSLSDMIYEAILRIRRPVHMKGLKKYILKKFTKSEDIWDDRCQEILINYFGMLDQNKDTVITVEDAEIFYASDDHIRSQYNDADAFFQTDLMHALTVAGANEQKKLVQMLLDRGELDREQIATVFGDKLFVPTQVSKDEL